MRTVLYLSPLRKLCSKIEPVSTLRSLALMTAPARASLMCSTLTMDRSCPSISNIVPLRKSLVEIISRWPWQNSGSGHREIWRSRWPEPKAGVDRLGAHWKMRDDVGPGPLTHGSGRLGSKDPVIRLSLFCQILQCQLISHKAKSGNHAPRGARGHAFGPELLTRVEVREVDLDHRQPKGLQAIVKGERVVRQGAGVDHDAGRSWPFLLQEVDDLALVIALKEGDLKTEPGGLFTHRLVEIIQRAGPIDVRFALAEQAAARRMNYHDALHASDLVMTRRTSAPGTVCPISAWPMRLGMTQATLPRRAFLSAAIAASTRLGSACGGLSGRPKASSSSS